MYAENYKMFMKEVKKVLNKCRDISFSKIGQFNIVKISLLPKFVSKFNTISTKIPGVVFVKTDKIVLKLI